MSVGTLWAIVPSCMVPTAQTVREDKYVTTAGVVKFAVGQSGSIVFVAAITESLPGGVAPYVMRVHLERDDPVQANREPDLLGTNAQLWRRRYDGSGGVEHVLDISSSDHGPFRGGNGVYVVDSIGENFLGLSITDYFYWVQLEIQQASAATTKTRNSVIGLELLLAIPS